MSRKAEDGLKAVKEEKRPTLSLKDLEELKEKIKVVSAEDEKRILLEYNIEHLYDLDTKSFPGTEWSYFRRRIGKAINAKNWRRKKEEEYKKLAEEAETLEMKMSDEYEQGPSQSAEENLNKLTLPNEIEDIICEEANQGFDAAKFSEDSIKSSFGSGGIIIPMAELGELENTEENEVTILNDYCREAQLGFENVLEEVISGTERPGEAEMPVLPICCEEEVIKGRRQNKTVDHAKLKRKIQSANAELQKKDKIVYNLKVQWLVKNIKLKYKKMAFMKERRQREMLAMKSVIKRHNIRFEDAVSNYILIMCNRDVKCHSATLIHDLTYGSRGN